MQHAKLGPVDDGVTASRDGRLYVQSCSVCVFQTVQRNWNSTRWLGADINATHQDKTRRRWGLQRHIVYVGKSF